MIVQYQIHESVSRVRLTTWLFKLWKTNKRHERTEISQLVLNN